MSTALAIAATTRVLSSMIDSAVQAANLGGILGSPPYLTTKAPDQLEVGTGEASHLALFLYQVTPNPGWREVALPSRNGAGARVDRPPLALDLHYLLIAYGDSDYVPQVLLGLGMQALHETPFLDRQQITKVFTPPPALSAIDAALATANLADQVEMIKVSPQPLTTEDLSKLWTAFGGKFRPSAGYEATVVLIESTATVQGALPVLTPNLSVAPFLAPVITAVSPEVLPWKPSGLQLTLSGSNLIGSGLVVLFDNAPKAPQVPTPVGTGGAGATTTVPPLPAGLNTLRVVQQVSIGQPPPKVAGQSNVSVFYLQPRISGAITIGMKTGTPPTTKVTVPVQPVIGPTQQVQLMLNELSPPANQLPLSFTYDADQPVGGSSVSFTTAVSRAGAYLVRVRVDGAESALETTAGAFSGPTVSL